eukprot:GFUD01024739.1.p2 GENE.GFUD01024739.1~~GFUD01024739.1.p2  ORF type:complete len:143 (+),score=43.80 GFUD01024739.1:52-480(+)
MGNSGGKAKISKEDMQFLQEKTQLDKDSIQEWYEGFLRDCPSGELTQTKFIAMYSKIFPSGNADNFSQNIFRTFDTNNSGTIDFRVVGAVYEMLGTDAGHTCKAQELFDKMDQNSDGLVSQDEFVEVCSKDQDLLNILQGKS